MDEKPEQKNKVEKTTKLSNKKSMFSNMPKYPSATEIKQKTNETVSEIQKRNANSVQAGQNYVNLIRSKKLASNKSELERSIEKESIMDLIQIGKAANNDPAESVDGSGSLAICNLLLRALLIARDRINEVDHLRDEQELRIKKLEIKLEKLEKNSKNSKTEKQESDE